MATQTWTSGSCTCTLTDAGVFTVSGNGPMADYSSQSGVPWDSARGSIKSVVIRSGVTSIGGYCFYSCGGLTSITISNSVTTLGDYCFSNCIGHLTSITIPNSVTTLGNYCFRSCVGLTSITIPNSVTTLGKGCFYSCGGLTSITISNSVTTLSNWCFGQCRGLTSITIPNSVTSLGTYCFQYCTSLTSITIPDSVTSLGNDCFGYCFSLTSITIPDSVTSIGDRCFYNCSSLNSVVFEGNSPTLGTTPFSGDSFTAHCNVGDNYNWTPSLMTSTYGGATSVTWVIDSGMWDCGAVPNTVTATLNTSSGLMTISGTGAMKDYSSSSNRPWYGSRNSIKSAIINNGVTSLGDYCFYACDGLTSITIPDSVTSLGDYCFYACDGLTSITIPESVTTLGNNCFEGCKFTLITIPNSVISIGNQCFDSCAKLSSLTIPNSVTSIGNQCFNSCYNLSSIIVSSGNNTYDSRNNCNAIIHTSTNKMIYGCKNTIIPDSVTSLGDACFYDCYKLTSVTIPDSVTSLGDYCFYACSGLTSITIPESVTSLGDYCFQYCSGLTSITIPESVTSLGDYCFGSCSALSSVVFEGNSPTLGDNPFNGDSFTAHCNVGDNYNWTPSLMSSTYGGATTVNWVVDSYAWDCGLTPNTVTATLDDTTGLLSISGNGAIADYSSPSNVPWYDFKNNINSAVVNSGVTRIGNQCFRTCSALTSITIPNSVTSLGNFCFGQCNGLTSVTIPDSVTSLGTHCFSSCEGLTSITIPDSVTSLSTGCFSGCSGLSSITIPDSVTSFGDSCFYHCISLTSVTISDSITSLGNNCFQECTGLTSVTIPDSVTSLSNGCFSGCSNLNSITIPDSVTSIGNDCFFYCRGLNSITIPDSVTSIGNNCFKNCSSLNSVVFEGNSPTLGTTPFSGDSFTAQCIVGTNYNWNPTIMTSDYGGATSVTWDPGYEWLVTDDITATILNGILTITGTGDMPDYESEESPWYLYENKIDTVILSEGITSIGDYNFEGLASVDEFTVPSTVNTLGSEIFSGCEGLETVNMLGHAPSIEDDTFNGMSFDLHYTGGNVYGYDSVISPTYGGATELNLIADRYEWSAGDTGNISITLDNGVLTVGGTGDMPDYDDENPSPWNSLSDDITILNINEGVTSIGNNSFTDLENITAVIIPDGVNSIGDNAFAGTSINEVTFDGDAPATVSDTSFKDLNMTAYYDGENETWTPEIKSATFGGSEKTVWKGILLDSWDIGTDENTVTAYVYNDGYLEIIGSGSINDFIDSNDVPWKDYITDITHVYVEENITNIPDYCFYGCNNTTSIDIPSTVVSYGDFAFYDCSSLAEVPIDDNIESIGAFTFYNTESMNVDAVISDYIAEIPESCFEGSGITNILLSENIDTLGNNCFKDCSSLETITFTGNAPTLGTTPLSGDSVVCHYPLLDNSYNYIKHDSNYGGAESTVWEVIYQDKWDIGTVPETVFGYRVDDNIIYINGTGRVNDYETALIPWSEYLEDFTTIYVDNGVTNIGNNYFKGCSNATSALLPVSVSTIGNSAFESCSSLTTITLPSGLNSIGNYCFYQCSGITTITIPQNVVSLPTRCFSDCTSLETVILPDNLVNIDSYCFYNDTSLANINIPSGITEIKIGTFYGCSSLENITLPENMTSLDNDAFRGCSSLMEINFPDTVNNIGNNCFNGCTSITKIIFNGESPEIGVTPFSGITCTAYYNVLNRSWTSDVRTSDYGGATSVTWESIPWDCGAIPDTVFAKFTDDSIIVYGEGAMRDYSESDRPIWHSYIGYEDIVNIIVEDGVTSVGDYAFADAEYVTYIDMTADIDTIGDYSFYNNSSVTDVDIPKVSSIGAMAFGECSMLNSVTFEGNPPNLVYEGNTGPFYNTLEGITFYYLSSNTNWLPSIRTNVYGGSTKATWSGFARSWDCGVAENTITATLDNNIMTFTGIGYCKNYTLETLPWIEEIPFINYVVMNDTIYSIGDYYFYNAVNLKSMSFHEYITEIGDYSLSGSGVKNIVFCCDYPSIGSNTLNGLTLIAKYYQTKNGWTPEVRTETFAGATKVTWKLASPELLDRDGLSYFWSKVKQHVTTYTENGYLPLSGGTLSGSLTVNEVTTSVNGFSTSKSYTTSLTTSTHLAGNKGTALINSTAPKGYTMLARMKSTNGVFTHGVYNADYQFYYTSDSTISAGTNSVTKTCLTINENGTVAAPNGFIGNVTGNCSGSSGSCTGNAATATTATNSNNSKLTHTVDNREYPLVFGSSFVITDAQQALRIGTPTATASNCALRAKAYCGAANTQGESYLVCGNDIALSSANNSRGSIYLYGTSTAWSRIIPGNNTTSNINITLPSASGTLGMMTIVNTYWGLTTPAGSSSDWIRTTINGIIPYQSGGPGSGHCGLGTTTWYFSYAYIDNIYGKLNGNCTGSSGSCTGNAASSTYATNIRVTDTDSNTWYPIVLSSGSAASTNYAARVDSDSILAYPGASPAAGTAGNCYLQLGNAKATATAGNKRGRIRIYGANTSFTELISGVGTTARTITFPDATGTVELTGHTHIGYMGSASTTKATATAGATTTSAHPAVVVTTYVNGDNWYRKYSDGWIEQGGVSYGVAGQDTHSVTLPCAMTTTSYTILVTGIEGGSGENSGINPNVYKTKTTISIRSEQPNRTKHWTVFGY